ncbi:MAG TPA: IPT/TIG domain-containing protein [Planctomycetota bacterium]
MLTSLILAAALQVGSRAATAAPEGGSNANVFVVNAGANAVTVERPTRTPLTLSGVPYNFSQPWDIVVVPSRNLAVVSNNGLATLTLFDAVPPFAFRGTATVSAGAATNLRGLSVSADERWVYVAGQITAGPVNNPAVFRLDLDAPANFVLAGTTALGGAVAEDCVVIDSSRVGGTAGAGPGRVYYSVPNGNFLGIVNENPNTGAASVNVNSASPVVTTPTQLELSPDGSFFFIGCQSDAFNQHIIRFTPTPAGQTITYPQIRGPFGKAFGHQVLDIAFQPNAHAFALVNESFGGHVLIELDPLGNNLLTQNEPPGISPAGRIRYNDNPPLVYFGRTDLTGTTYGLYDPFGGPTAVSVPVTSGAGPKAFAFLVPPPGPAISGVWPSGMVSVAGSTIEIRGSNFDPASQVVFINSSSGATLARTETFVNTGLIQVNGDGLLPVGLYDVRVTNPDTQTILLSGYFLSISPPPIVAPDTVVVPSRFEGYALRSVPQYYSAADLLASITAAFGGYSPSNVRAFLQEESGYVELNQVEPNRDLSGSPFWIISRLGGTLTLSRPPVGQSLQAVAQDQKILILQPGWNLFTQPTFNVNGFPVPGGRLDLNGVAVWSDGALSIPATPGGSLADTATDGVTSFPAEFVNGAYVFLTAADSIFTGRGYWLRNNTTGPLYLRFLTSDAQPKQIAARSTSAAAATTLPPPPPGGALEEEAGTSGCGLTGLELLALLGLRRRRR